MQPLLRSLRDRFGCNVCGEGGEYETLTLDCPAFKHSRIALDDWQVSSHLLLATVALTVDYLDHNFRAP